MALSREAALLLLALVVLQPLCSANNNNNNNNNNNINPADQQRLAGLFGDTMDHDQRVVDDETFYVKPGATPTEMLEARGYLAREFHFLTPDNYSIAITRGRNPLIEPELGAPNHKLPILFVHGATVSAASYLLNSAYVRPRTYQEAGAGAAPDLSRMDTEQLARLVAEDPARKSLPFLAMNFGYEVWIMERRGFAGSRLKRGHEGRTVADALRAMPATMLGNAMDGFALDANLDSQRPRRARFTRHTKARPWARSQAAEGQAGGQLNQMDAAAAAAAAADQQDQQDQQEDQRAHYSAEEFERAEQGGEQAPLQEFRPHTRAGRVFKRLVKGGAELRRRLGPLRHANVLQTLFTLAKLPGIFRRLVSNITLEFVQTFDPDFWRFSLDEQVAHDLPGAVDFVLEATGAPKLHTVGLSCGGALILLALAEQPQLAEKISRAVLWAPSVNMGSRTDIVYLLGHVIPLIQGYVGPLPFVFLTPIIEILLQTLCSSDFMQRTVCTGAIDTIMGHSGAEAPMRPFMLGNMLQPTSSGELFQLGQFARTQVPCKFSLNSAEENQRRYGQPKPPCYDLSRVALRNISFYGGARDRLVSPDDIATTVAQMSLPAELNIIKRAHFNHLGAFLHKRADRLIIMPSLLDMERSQAAERHQDRPRQERHDRQGRHKHHKQNNHHGQRQQQQQQTRQSQFHEEPVARQAADSGEGQWR